MQRSVGMVLVALAMLVGVAQADETHRGFLPTGAADVYHAQCKSAKTHCMFMYLCDPFAGSGSNETWETIMTVISPLTMFGKTGYNFIRDTVFDNCTLPEGIQLCRPGTTVGAMRALITVTRPVANSAVSAYDIAFGCYDKDHALLPGTTDSLDLVSD